VVSERLRDFRKERGLTQRSVAIGVGLTERNYQALEYGNYNPRMDTVLALADYFGVSIDYLVGRTDNPEINK
jgi:transcriptional regulator with XRE-family HTH domain